MRTLPLVLATIAALLTAVLLAPAAALAAGPAASTGRFFVITGLVLGNQKADTAGKVAIANGQLSASVGCNAIGGKASLDGDTVTIGTGLSMTLMGCPTAEARLEDMLIKVLGHGPFKITPTAWVGAGASILATEIPTVAPAPGGGGPNEPVGSSPGIVIVRPPINCPETGGGGATGSGGASGSGGSGGSGVGSGSSSGSDGSTVGSSGSGSAPSATAIAVPDGPMSSAAGSSGGVLDPAPPPSGVAVPPGPPQPAASGATDPVPGLTASGAPGQPGIGSDPGVGKPTNPCLAGTYQVAEPQGGAAVAPKAVDSSEHASITSTASDSWLPFGAGLAVIAAFAAIGLLGFRRRRGRTTSREPAAAEIVPADGSTEGPGPTPR